MTWLLIDGNNWFAQCDFASPEFGRANFAKRLQTLTGQVKHTHCVVCWDEGKSFRCGLSDQYKAHRDAKPRDYAGRLAETRQWVNSHATDSISFDGYEADDLVATLAAIAKEEGERAIVFSSDKDLHQILSSGTISQVTKVTRKTQTQLAFETMTADTLHAKYGVHPWQWVDYRTLVGDDSDGIKGCPSFGPKTAAELLASMKTLDAFYESPFMAPLTPRLRTLLTNFRDQVPLKRRLLTLVDSVPLPATFFAKVAS